MEDVRSHREEAYEAEQQKDLCVRCVHIASVPVHCVHPRFDRSAKQRQTTVRQRWHRIKVLSGLKNKSYLRAGVSATVLLPLEGSCSQILCGMVA